MTELPLRSDHFAYHGWRLIADEPKLAFAYECARHGAFEEVVTFDASPAALLALTQSAQKGLLDLLGVALGVSYYKVGAAPVVHLPPATTETAAMARALYGPGLAEFAVRAGLPTPFAPQIVAAEELPTSGSQAPPPSGAGLVAWGGGKDSYVAREILHKAGHAVSLCSVVLSNHVREAIAATAPQEVLFLRRQLDPRLAEATKSGFNGHVPITAINTMMLVIQAALSGLPTVVFANERSADEATMVLDDGSEANHQYSKSSAFELLLRAAIASVAPDAPYPYSILRPYSELWIGKAFAKIDEAHHRFTSCNKNFRIDGSGRVGWCGACAKCAFTSLILAPYLSPSATDTIFGERFLDRADLLPYYTELCGLSDHKPWDCVGTIDECRAALFAASKNGYEDTRAVRDLLPRVLAEAPDAALTAAMAEGLRPHGQAGLPSDVFAATLDL